MPKYRVLRAFGLQGGGTAMMGTVVELTAAEAKPLAKLKKPAIGLYFEDEDETEEEEQPKPLSQPRRAGRKRPRKQSEVEAAANETVSDGE